MEVYTLILIALILLAAAIFIYIKFIGHSSPLFACCPVKKFKCDDGVCFPVCDESKNDEKNDANTEASAP